MCNSQERYLTKSGAINFFSKTAMEDITADNNQVLSIVDAASGKMAISILMKSLLFKKALMQEHFNENYVESDKFPKANFKGTIVDFESINITNLESKVDGKLQSVDTKLTNYDTKLDRFEIKVEKVKTDMEKRIQESLDNPLAN
jgi:uncharacterized membrane protein